MTEAVMERGRGDRAALTRVADTPLRPPNHTRKKSSLSGARDFVVDDLASNATSRKHIFDPAKPVTCHCISRCVRRSPLLEHEERRRALADRLVELVLYFAIDVLEWALLTNHFHLVASTHPDLAALWSDREVVTRWRTLSPDYAWRLRNEIDKSLPAQPEEIAAALADPALVARWRRELADLSTFHKFLKQRIARIINLEDDVTGQSNGCGHYGSPDCRSAGVRARGEGVRGRDSIGDGAEARARRARSQ